MCRRSGPGSFTVDARGREGDDARGREGGDARRREDGDARGREGDDATEGEDTHTTGQGGVFIVPSFCYEKGAPVLTVTAVHQFSGSLGFVSYHSCCSERYKPLVSVHLEDNQTMHIRVSGDGCRFESVHSLFFTVD